VVWLHILVGPCWCVYVAMFGSSLLPIVQWQVTRDSALRAKVNRLQKSVTAGSTSEVRPVEGDTPIPRSRRPIAVEDDQTGDEIS